MLRSFLTLVAASSLAACSTAATEPLPAPRAMQPEPNASIATPVTSSAEIAGRWDVVSFEGYEPARMQGATPAAFARFDDQGVGLRIECNHSGASGFVRDGRFVPRPGTRIQTQMGCGAEREERDRRYFSFFDRSPTVERLADGRLRLVAGDSVLLLERPEQRRLAFVPDRSELDGEWRMESLTRYGRQGGYSGIGLSDVSGRIVIEGNRLGYERCPQYDLTFSYSSDGRLVKIGGPSIPEEPDCPALDYPDYEAPALPSALEILPLLHSNPQVENVGEGRMLIANERLGLLLTRASERR